MTSSVILDDAMDDAVQSAVERIAKSPEYLGLSGFALFFEKGCRRNLKKFITERCATQIRELLSLLKARVNGEMLICATGREKLDFVHEIHRRMPLFPKIFEIDTPSVA